MIRRLTFLKSMKTVTLSALLLSLLPVVAAPVSPVVVTATNPLSVFIQPNSPKEGRDPFFPASNRPYQLAVLPSAKASEFNLDLLVLQGISGLPPHRLVIINKRTFAVGDLGEVSTSQGRIRINCLEIKAHSAVIEANGQRHELRYEEKQ